MPLPRLTGNANDLSWEEFLCQLYEIGNANGWQKEHYCSYIPQCLAGEAKDVYRFLSTPTKETWEDLVKELGSGIRQLLTKERAQQLLASCKQKEGEAPSTYMLRVKKLAERGYPVHKPAVGAPAGPTPAGYWTAEQLNTTIISHFRHGLLPKLHAEVIRRQAEATPHAELQKVIDEDRIQQSIRERQQEHDGSSMALAAINAISAKVDTLASEQEQLRRIAVVQPYREEARPAEGFSNTGFPSSFSRNQEPYQQGSNRRPVEDRGRNWNNPRSNNQQQWSREPDHRNQQWNGQAGQSGRNNFGRRSFENSNWNRNGNQDYSRGRSGPPRFQRGRGSWSQSNDRRSGEDYNRNQWQRRNQDDRQREPSAGPSGGRRGIGFRLPEFISIVAVLALASALLMATAEEHHHHKERQYQICSITKAPIYVSRPLPERCHLPPEIETVKARVQIYRPRISRIEIDAYSCTNVTYLTCGSYFFGIRTSARNAEPTYNAIPADACWKFAEDANLTRAANTSRAEHDIWTTGRMPSIPDGFIGDACAESWNVVAQRGSVDSKNGLHIESDLMHPNNCTISDHKCIDDGHIIVWKVPDMHIFCSHELAGEFDALVSMSHVLLPPVQSAFVLKPHSEIPKTVQECIGGTVLAAGNDAFIKFLDTLPANITSPWITHNTTTSSRTRRSTETQLRTAFAGTERRGNELHFPSTTETRTLTQTQQLEAIKLKFQALRAVLGLPLGQAFYDANVNRLAYTLKQRRLERQRKQAKWRETDKAKTVSRSPTRQTWTFAQQQAALRAVNSPVPQSSNESPKKALQHMPVDKTTTTTMKTFALPAAIPTTAATSTTKKPPTTTTTTGASLTTTIETPQFPYTEPKIYLAKKAVNGSRYFQGTNRKKYSDLKQMPHGSAVLEKETDVVHHVYWPSSNPEEIRLYRLSRFEHEEARRQGPRFRPSRRQRHEPENLLLEEIRQKDTLLPSEAQEIYVLWAGLEERAHFNDVLNDFLLEEAEYGTYEEPTLGALEQEDELLPIPEEGRREGAKTLEETTLSEATTDSEADAQRQKRSPKTSKEWNYDEDDERDRAASKHMKHRFDKDLNATSSGEESEEEPDADTRPSPETDAIIDQKSEAEAEGLKTPSNVSAEMSQTARTVNTKMQYAIDTWGISDSDNFRHLYQTICEMDTNQVRLTDFMWELMPTKAIRYWLRRTDIAAVPAGEALAIYPCTQVQVDEVHWSQKVNSTCYADIPVTFDGKLWFFQPGSRDLQRQSRTVNCSSKAVNVFRNGSLWLSSDGHQTHVNALEHHLKLKHHSFQLNLSAPSIYQSDATEVADRLTRFTNYERRINRLEDVMYAVELRVPASGTNALTEAGKELRAALNRTVNVAKQRLENWNPFDGLFNRWYHWLVAVVSILLAIASIILLWYCWPAVVICRDCFRNIRRRRRQWMNHRRERQSARRLIELQPVIAAVQAELKTHEPHQPFTTKKDEAAINATAAVPVPHPHRIPTAPPEYRTISEITRRRDTSLYEYYPEINLFQLFTERERPYITMEVTASGQQFQAIADTGADANLCSKTFSEATKWHLTPMAQPLYFGGTTAIAGTQAIRMSDGSFTPVQGVFWGSIFKDDAEAKRYPIPALGKELPKPLIIGGPSLAELNKQLGFAKLRYTGRKWKLSYDRPSKGKILRILTEHQKKTKDLESMHIISPNELKPDMQTWKHRLYLAANLQGEDITCRWDTGSPRSLCKASTAYKLSLNKSNERAPQVYYVNGELLQVVAVAETYVDVGHVTSKLSILVVPDSFYTAAEGLLLGLDWTADVAERCELIFNLEEEKKHLSLDGVNVAYGQADNNGYAHATRWRRRHVEYPPNAAVPRLKRTKSYEELSRKHEDLNKDHGRLRQQLEERTEQLKKQKERNGLDETTRTKELRQEVRKLIDEKKSAEREHGRRLKQVREDLQQMEQRKDHEMKQTLQRKAELLQEIDQLKQTLYAAMTENRAAEEDGHRPRASEDLMNRVYGMLRTWKSTEQGEGESSTITTAEKAELETLRTKQKELYETLLTEVRLKNALIQSNQRSSAEHKKDLEHQRKQHQYRLDEVHNSMRLLEGSVKFLTSASYNHHEQSQDASTSQPSEPAQPLPIQYASLTLEHAELRREYDNAKTRWSTAMEATSKAFENHKEECRQFAEQQNALQGQLAEALSHLADEQQANAQTQERLQAAEKVSNNLLKQLKEAQAQKEKSERRTAEVREEADHHRDERFKLMSKIEEMQEAQAQRGRWITPSTEKTASKRRQSESETQETSDSTKRTEYLPPSKRQHAHGRCKDDQHSRKGRTPADSSDDEPSTSRDPRHFRTGPTRRRQRSRSVEIIGGRKTTPTQSCTKNYRRWRSEATEELDVNVTWRNEEAAEAVARPLSKNQDARPSTTRETLHKQRRRQEVTNDLGMRITGHNGDTGEKTGTTTPNASETQGHIYATRTARPSLEVLMNVNGHREACLFDTGCNVTYLSRDVLPLVGSPKLQPSRLPTARTANGGLVGFEASVELPIQLRSRTVKQTFHVTAPENCPSKIVIGTDAMKKLAVNRRIIIDLEEAQILLDDEAVDMVQPLAFINALLAENDQQAEEFPLIARVAVETIIPPRGDYHLKAYVEGDINPEACYITEERPHEYCAKVGKIFINAPMDEKKTVPIRVLNMSSAPVKIHKGARIATLSEATEPEKPPKEDPRKRRWKNSNDEPIDVHYVPKEADLEDIFEFPEMDWEEQIQLLDLSKSLFNDEQQRLLRRILKRRRRAFVQKDGRIGCYRGSNILHRIELKAGAKPARRRAIRLPLNQQKEILRQLKDLLDKGLIQPSDSTFAAPVLLVRKRNGEFRFVCDYRGLNQSLADQCFVLPNIQTLIDTCAGQKIYTTVDFAQGYMQTRVAPEDVHKTAFITEFGLFEWLVTPFGMRHSGETFNKLMRELQRQVSFRLMAFVDDVILCADDIPRHLQQIDEFLGAVEANNLTLKLAKCVFGQDRVKHLGVMFRGDGYEMDPEKVAAILEQAPPTTITDLRKFIGVINYFRRHIADCAAILGPLYELLSAERIEWTPRHQEAFDEVKRRITSSPVLGSFRTGEPCVLEVDASKAGFGGCILQKDKEGILRPIAFVSRRTNKHEKNYHATELEACGITWILSEAAPYIIGAPQSLVRTDNAACVALLTKHDESLTSRMNKYRLAIQGYNVKIEHRSGKSNVVADYLSRYHYDEEASPPESKHAKEATEEPVAEEGTISAIMTEDLRLTLPRIQAEQKRDAFTKPLYDALAHKRFPQQPEARRRVQRLMGKYTVKQNTLYFIKPAHIEPRIVLPSRYQEAAVRELHEDPLEGGHLGTFKTMEKLRTRFYWPNMAEYVNQVIAGCETCQKRKTPPQLVSTEPLATWPAPRWPTDRVHIDLMGPLPLSHRRFRYVMTATDALTKWITAIPLRNQTAEEVKNAFEKDIICHFGVPTYVVSDCGTNLLSKQFAELAEAYAFKHLTISPYHQQSNGQAERSHSTLANMISAYANDNGTNWCSILAPTTFAYNCSIHRVTGRSPFQMLYGREPCLPIDLRTKLFQEEQIRERRDGGRGCEEARQEAEAAMQQQSETMKQLREAWKLVRESIEEKTAIRDAYRNEKVGAKQHDFQEGELVLKKLAHERMEHKFAARFEGPYKIVRIQKPNAFIQKLHEEATPTKVHFDLLKPFKEPISLPHYATEEGPEGIEGTIATVDGDSRGKEDEAQRGAIAAARKAGIAALREAAEQSYRPVSEENLKVYEGLVAVNIHTDEKMFEEPRTDLEVYVAVNVNIIALEAEAPIANHGSKEDTKEKDELPTIAVCNGSEAFSEDAYYRTYFGKPDTKPKDERREKARTYNEASREDNEQTREEEEDRSWSNVSESECTEATEKDRTSAAEERINQEAEKKAVDAARPECRSHAEEHCSTGAGRPECRGQAEVHRIDTSSSHGDVETGQQRSEVGGPESRGQADECRIDTGLTTPERDSSSTSIRNAAVFLTREDAGTAQHHHRAQDGERYHQSANVTTCDAKSSEDPSNNAKDDLSDNASIGEKVEDHRSKA